MYSRMLTLPLHEENSIFLFGPRGTGKTAWLKKMLPNAVYIDLLDFSYFQPLSAHPNDLQKWIPPHTQEWIIIDEVQRIPELLNEVHRLIESYHYQFILTGSSARTLKRKGINLLAGRALRYHMHPLTLQELGADFHLSTALQYGMLPATKSKPNPEKYLETYIQTYLREEVLQEGLTRNIGNFSRFLEAASFSQGSVLNITEIAREVGINRQVITNYFSILEDLLLSMPVPAFTKRAKRRLINHPKFYYFDTGIYRTIRPTGPFDKVEEIDGIGLETLFLQSIRAINDYQNLKYGIYYWRTANGIEVDFILYGPNGIHAFEIKRTKNITGKTLRGLNIFQKDYPEAKLYLIYLGDHREYHDKINIIPFVEALKMLPEILTSSPHVQGHDPN